jgi:peptidoglycan/xylan/chitin deacetylase (PgdA/CDA1 family)
MKNFSRRDFLKLSGTAMLAAAMPGFQFAQADDLAPPPLIWRGSTRHRYVALTYDDCYLLNRTHDLEKLLAEYPEIKITLFPVGVAILNLHSQDPGIWNRFLEKGHEIGYHSWDHNNFSVMSSRVALDDYSRWFDALSNVLGFVPTIRFGRPTYGSLSPSFDDVCKQNGLVNTMWSTGWGGALEDGVRAAQNSKNGDIVLLHIRTQDYNTSREAFPWLRENNWGAVTMSKLYDDLLLEQINSDGCDVGGGSLLTRTCIE